ncbi:hypothetical protein KW782_00515 [Candidatus Parcubacteria bacterium]|nr:hypothetical protein [Candidatus Parcubacteria bacterium]
MQNKKVFFIVITAFVIGGLLGYCLAQCPWFSKSSATNTEIAAGMKEYNFGGVNFEYPADWNLTPDYYSTPAGFTDQVGLTLVPPNQKAGEDQIGIGGRQVICAMFSNDRIKCKEINSLAFYTASVNPDIVAVYNKILDSAYARR